MASKFPSAAKAKKATNIWEGLKNELPAIKQDKQALQKLKDERAKKEAEAELIRKQNAINGVDPAKAKKPAAPAVKPAAPKATPAKHEEDLIEDDDDASLKEAAKKMPKKVTIAPPVQHEEDDEDHMKVDEEDEDDSDHSDDDGEDDEDDEEEVRQPQAKKARTAVAPPAKKQTKTKPAPPAPKKRAPPSHKAAREKVMNGTIHDPSGITPAQRLHFQEVYRLNQSLQVFGQQLQAASSMLRQGSSLLGLPSIPDDTQQLQGFPVHGMIGWHGDNNDASAAPSRARGGSTGGVVRRQPNKEDDREFAKNVLTTEMAEMTPAQADEFITKVSAEVAKKIKGVEANLPIAKKAKKISENIGGFFHNNGTTLGRYTDKTANLLVTLAAYIRTVYPAAMEKAKFSGTSRADVLTRIVRSGKETLIDATPLGALAEKGPIPDSFIDAFANVIAYYECFLCECEIEIVHVAPSAASAAAADGEDEEEAAKE